MANLFQVIVNYLSNLELPKQCFRNTVDISRDLVSPDGGETLLHWFVEHGNMDQIRMVLEYINVHVVNGAGRTPLFQAVYRQDENIIKELLKAGASIFAQDNSGCIIYNIAKERRGVKLVPLCREVGISLELLLSQCDQLNGTPFEKEGLKEELRLKWAKKTRKKSEPIDQEYLDGSLSSLLNSGSDLMFTGRSSSGGGGSLRRTTSYHALSTRKTEGDGTNNERAPLRASYSY